MLIPKHHRQFLRSIGRPHWFWEQAPDWAFGERYRLRDGSIAYIGNGDIITIRRGAKILWAEGCDNRCVCCGAIIPEGRQVCPKCERGERDG